jgi:hypothetical protein
MRNSVRRKCLSPKNCEAKVPIAKTLYGDSACRRNTVRQTCLSPKLCEAKVPVAECQFHWTVNRFHRLSADQFKYKCKFSKPFSSQHLELQAQQLGTHLLPRLHDSTSTNKNRYTVRGSHRSHVNFLLESEARFK